MQRSAESWSHMKISSLIKDTILTEEQEAVVHPLRVYRVVGIHNELERTAGSSDRIAPVFGCWLILPRATRPALPRPSKTCLPV